jgi:hypothetical protein
MVHEWSLILQPASEERSVFGSGAASGASRDLCLPPMTDVREDAVMLNQRHILTIDYDLARVDAVDQQVAPCAVSSREHLISLPIRQDSVIVRPRDCLLLLADMRVRRSNASAG